MFGFGTISNTTINANGHSVRMYSNSLSPWGCYNSYTSFSPGCFGFGFPPCGNSFAAGAGIGLGFAAGMGVINLIGRLLNNLSLIHI